MRQIFLPESHLRENPGYAPVMKKVLLRGLKSLNSQVISRFCQSEAINDALIIGGGCFGASLAYHLTKYGFKNVILLEKSELTAGSTWHAAGLVTYFHPGINMKRVHFDSLELYKSLEDETGKAVGLHTPGSIRLITTSLRRDEMFYQMSRQGWNQADQSVITPKEIKEMCPLINIDKVLAGLYNPEDGHIDPYSLTIALVEGAKMRGAKIFQNSPVTSLQPISASPNKTDYWQVSTASGLSYRARHVINCAGLWAIEVNKMAGIPKSPLVQIHHQYVVTTALGSVQNLPREMPVLRDLENSYYLRQERGGILMGPYEHPDSMKMSVEWAKQGVPKSFGKELFAPDLDRIMPYIEKAMHRIPVLKLAAIKTCVCGPIMYTPDVLPLAGPVLEQPNYWIAAGSGYGIVHAGGIGSYLAKWIVNGEPPYDLLECDPGRFKETWADEVYVFAKARETYGLNNMIYYPKEQRWAGRPTPRATNLSKYLRERRGARLGFVNGWEQALYFVPGQPLKDEIYETKANFRRGPEWFPQVQREALNVLRGVGVIDLSTFGKFIVQGKDSTLFLDYIFANTLPKLGRTNISHAIAPLSGRVYSEMTLSRLSDHEFLLLTGSASEIHDLRWLKYHARDKNFDVEIKNITDEMSCLSVAGPLSAKVLSLVGLPNNINKKTWDDWPFLGNKSICLAGGIPVLAIRVSYTGEMGWEIYHNPKDSVELYRAIVEGGHEFGIKDFGAYAMNSLRIEKGFRAWGQEMNMDKDPFEAGLANFIKLDKKVDFLGKSTLREIAQFRTKEMSGNEKSMIKSLCFLTVHGNDQDSVDPEGNESLWHDGKVVGNTTSGAYGFEVGQSVCMAYLPHYLLKETKAKVEIELLGKLYEVSVHNKPLAMTEQMKLKKNK